MEGTLNPILIQSQTDSKKYRSILELKLKPVKLTVATVTKTVSQKDQRAALIPFLQSCDQIES